MVGPTGFLAISTPGSPQVGQIPYACLVVILCTFCDGTFGPLVEPTADVVATDPGSDCEHASHTKVC